MSKSIEARERVVARVREILAHEFPNVRSKVDRLFNGPPVGWAVQMRVTGPDRNEVRRLAGEVAEVMRATPELSNVHDDWLEPMPSLKLDIDQDRARALGVPSQIIRRSLQAMLSGFQIGEFRENDETIKVMLREPSNTRNLLSALDNVYVKTASGASIPLRQVAKLQSGPRARHSVAARPVAVHNRARPRTGQRAVARCCQCRVCQAKAAARRPTRRVPNRAAGCGRGVRQEPSSINEKMPVMVLAILLLLMVQLQHFGKTLLVVVTGPLGLIGAATALLVFQAPVWIRRHPGCHRARRHHHAQQRDPRRSDRPGHGGRARRVQRDRRIGRAPLSTHRTHGGCGRAGPSPARRREFSGHQWRSP